MGFSKSLSVVAVASKRMLCLKMKMNLKTKTQLP